MYGNEHPLLYSCPSPSPEPLLSPWSLQAEDESRTLQAAAERFVADLMATSPPGTHVPAVLSLLANQGAAPVPVQVQVGLAHQ